MISIITITFLALALAHSVSATTMTSTFECDSGDNKSTTITYYGYLKEPKLEESQYKEGYSVKTFNYLYEGDISLKSNFVYFDGEKDESHKEIEELNRTVAYDKSVVFDGKHGISEIIAEGYYPNNRAVAAKKKIRYDDLGYDFSSYTGKAYPIIGLGRYSLTPKQINMYDEKGRLLPDNRIKGKYSLGNSTTAEKFSENAHVVMGMGEDPNYLLNYNTWFKNATFETQEAIGWSNRTGSRRIDWEQEALIKGDVAKVTNILALRGFRFPGAGENREWLPCCMGGTVPTMDELQTGWPTQSTKNTLRADTIYPNQVQQCILVKNTTCENTRICDLCKLTVKQAVAKKAGTTQNCQESKSCQTNTYRECTQLDLNPPCSLGSCPGYECVYTFEEEPDYIPSKLSPTAEFNRGKIHIINRLAALKDKRGTTTDITTTNENELENAMKGDQIVYDIIVDHTDISTMKKINISDSLSDKLKYNSSTVTIKGLADAKEIEGTAKPDENGRDITWNIGELPPQTSITITVYADIIEKSADLVNKIKENYASASGLLNELIEKSDTVPTEIADE
jgi:fimbrial isopeptide formation D2 family protein